MCLVSLSRYFNEIKRTSRLGRLLALSLEILYLYLGARVSRAINQEQKKNTALNEQNKQKAVLEQFKDRQPRI